MKTCGLPLLMKSETNNKMLDVNWGVFLVSLLFLQKSLWSIDKKAPKFSIIVSDYRSGTRHDSELALNKSESNHRIQKTQHCQDVWLISKPLISSSDVSFDVKGLLLSVSQTWVQKRTECQLYSWKLTSWGIRSELGKLLDCTDFSWLCQNKTPNKYCIRFCLLTLRNRCD